MTVLETDLLADLIHRKRHCLVQLRTMGEKQLELVRGGCMTELLDVLAMKQKMLGQLQGIERELDPFRNQDPESRPWRTQRERQTCADELAGCEVLLAEIVCQERQSEQELVQRREETAAQLQGVHWAHQARQAYLAPSRASLGQLDLSSEEY